MQGPGILKRPPEGNCPFIVSLNGESGARTVDGRQGTAALIVGDQERFKRRYLGRNWTRFYPTLTPLTSSGCAHLCPPARPSTSEDR